MQPALAVAFHRGHRKVDGFQNRRLKRIMKIQFSYYRHVTNASVLQQAGAKTMSSMLLERQLIWMGTFARRNTTDIVRHRVFDPHSLSFQPREPASPRRRGRPKMSWAKGVFKHALTAAGGAERLNSLLSHKPQSEWEAIVKTGP